MTVSSYLELYTTFIGWHFFSVIAQLLAMTGVIWIPLILLVVDSVKKARSSMHANAGAVAAYEQVETNAFIMIVMMSLVMYPAVPFSPQEVRLMGSSACGKPDKELATATSSTYPRLDRVVDGQVKVPIWWSIVFGLSAGITHGVSASLPCSSDLSGLSHDLSQIAIQDPLLREEYVRFANECYIPVLSYISRTETLPDGLQEAIRNRPGDVYWPGGKALLETPKLYPWYHATHPVRGWPYREERDKDLRATVNDRTVQSSRWGKPSCKEWWLGEKDEGESLSEWWSSLIGDEESDEESPTTGLRRRLIAHAEDEFDAVTRIDMRLSQDVTDAFSGEKYADALIKRLVSQSITPSDMTTGSGIGDTDEGKAAGGLAVTSGAASGATSAAMAAGTGAAAVPAVTGAVIGGAAIAAKAASELAGLYAQVYILKKGLPIVQALLLMLIVMFLPFALVLGSYDLSTVLPASVALMAIKFFGAIWIVLGFLQNSLMSLMFPDEAAFILGADTLSINAILIGLIFGFAHLGAIYVLFKVLSWGAQGADFGNIDLFGGADMGRSAKQGGSGGTGSAMSSAKVKMK